MTRSESLEEGLIATSSVVLDPNSTTDGIGDGSGMSECDSSATHAVVFSTVVALCGSFTFGCSVSNHTL